MELDSTNGTASRILLVAENGVAKDMYCKIALEVGVECLCVGSLDELQRKYPGTNLRGILLDVPTVIKASMEEKRHIQKLGDSFPMLRLRWNENSESIMGLYSGGKLSGSEVIRDFFQREVQGFVPRRIRVGSRCHVSFNILVGETPGFSSHEAEKAFTANASPGGCFVYTARSYRIGQGIYVVINEFDDHTPIASIVRWTMPWGERLKPPGIGISFEQMTSSQARQLGNFL